MIAEVSAVTVRGAARALLPARKRHEEERRKPWSEHEQDSGHLPGSEGEHILQEQLGTSQRAKQFYDKQVVDYLTPVMQEFIGRMEMAFIATSDPTGECDCSFRAGAPGFIRVIDDRTIAYPELRGNGVMASMGNMLQNPHVGLFFVDFSRDLIGLHVNGDASIVPPAHMLEFNIEIDEAENAGKKPVQWVLIRVTEAYIHCSKHIPLLVPQSRVRHWGTDNPRHKGGDYFGVTAIKAESGLIEPRRRTHAGANGAASHPAESPPVPVANGSDAVPAVNGSVPVASANGSHPASNVNGSAPPRAANGSAPHLVVDVSALVPVASAPVRAPVPPADLASLPGAYRAEQHSMVNHTIPLPMRHEPTLSVANGAAFLSAPTPGESAPMPKANGSASGAPVEGSAPPPAEDGLDPLPMINGSATLRHVSRSSMRPQCNGSASLPRASASSSPPTANGSAVPH